MNALHWRGPGLAGALVLPDVRRRPFQFAGSSRRAVGQWSGIRVGQAIFGAGEPQLLHENVAPAILGSVPAAPGRLFLRTAPPSPPGAAFRTCRNSDADFRAADGMATASWAEAAGSLMRLVLARKGLVRRRLERTAGVASNSSGVDGAVCAVAFVCGRARGCGVDVVFQRLVDEIDVRQGHVGVFTGERQMLDIRSAIEEYV